MYLVTKAVLETSDIDRFVGLVTYAHDELRVIKGEIGDESFKRRYEAFFPTRTEREICRRIVSRCESWTCNNAPETLTLPIKEYDVWRRFENLLLTVEPFKSF